MSLIRALALVVLFSSFNLHADDATQRLIESLDIGESPDRPFDFEKFKKAIDDGAEVNTRSDSYLTPLYMATVSHAWLAQDHKDKAPLLEAVKILIAKGANVNAQNYGGSTVLMHAIHRSHSGKIDHPLPKRLPIISALLKAENPKPDLNIRNSSGQTALNYAIGYNEVEISKIFVAVGADPKSVADNGDTMLHDALDANSKEMFEFVASLFSADELKKLANTANKAGRTPLMQIADNGRPEFVSKFVNEFGANPNLVDVEDMSALALAELRLQKAKIQSNSDKISTAIEMIEQIKAVGGVNPSRDPDDITCEDHNGYPTSFARLRKTIKKCDVTDVEELFALLPKAYLSNYTLAHRSQGRGRVNSSSQFPRVILTGRTGKSLLAVSGDPNKPLYNNIEIIDFDEDNKTFELREIDLTKDGDNRFSHANPKRCTTCHSEASPRPNWYNWFFWPGMYKGEQEVIYSNEKRFYEEYQAEYQKQKAAGKGIYRFLSEAQGQSAFQTINGPLYAPSLMNVPIDGMLEHYLTEMIIEILATDERLKPVKYSLLAAMSCESPIEEFVSPDVKSRLIRPYGEIYEETVKLARKEFEDRLALLKEFVPGTPQGQYTISFVEDETKSNNWDKARVSKLRYLVEGLGVPMEWSTIPNNNYYAFSALSHLEINLWKRLLKNRGDEAKLWSIYRAAYDKLDFSDTNYTFFSGPEFSEDKNKQDSTALCKEIKRLALK